MAKKLRAVFVSLEKTRRYLFCLIKIFDFEDHNTITECFIDTVIYFFVDISAKSKIKKSVRIESCTNYNDIFMKF